MFSWVHILWEEHYVITPKLQMSNLQLDTISTRIELKSVSDVRMQAKRRINCSKNDRLSCYLLFDPSKNMNILPKIPRLIGWWRCWTTFLFFSHILSRINLILIEFLNSSLFRSSWRKRYGTMVYFSCLFLTLTIVSSISTKFY